MFKTINMYVGNNNHSLVFILPTETTSLLPCFCPLSIMWKVQHASILAWSNTDFFVGGRKQWVKYEL